MGVCQQPLAGSLTCQDLGVGNWGGPGRDVRVDLGSGFLALSLPATLSSWVSGTHTLRLVSEAGCVTGVIRAQSRRAECPVYGTRSVVSNSTAPPHRLFPRRESLQSDKCLFCVFPPHALLGAFPLNS